MRRIVTISAGAVVLAAVLALGIAVAGLASSGSLGSTGATTETNETNEQPKTLTFASALTAGAEVPRPKGTTAGAGGSFKLTYHESSGSYSIAWTLSFKNLTGAAVAAHIHRGKPGKAGPVLVSLCGPCRSGTKGKRNVSHAIATTLEKGSTYVNVHTAKNPGGEIRGQLKQR